MQLAIAPCSVVTLWSIMFFKHLPTPIFYYDCGGGVGGGGDALLELMDSTTPEKLGVLLFQNCGKHNWYTNIICRIYGLALLCGND